MKKGNVKLTLSVNKDLLEKYKEYCRKEGLMLSKQFENFIFSQLQKKK